MIRAGEFKGSEPGINEVSDQIIETEQNRYNNVCEVVLS